MAQARKSGRVQIRGGADIQNRPASCRTSSHWPNIKPLAEHQAIGRKTLRDDIRELVEPRYGFIIPYTVIDNTVFILRIYSAKRYPLDPAYLPDPGNRK